MFGDATGRLATVIVCLLPGGWGAVRCGLISGKLCVCSSSLEIEHNAVEHSTQHYSMRVHVDSPLLLSAAVVSGFASVDSSFAAWSSVAAAASGACSDMRKQSSCPEQSEGGVPSAGASAGATSSPSAGFASATAEASVDSLVRVGSSIALVASTAVGAIAASAIARDVLTVARCVRRVGGREDANIAVELSGAIGMCPG